MLKNSMRSSTITKGGTVQPPTELPSAPEEDADEDDVIGDDAQRVQ